MQLIIRARGAGSSPSHSGPSIPFCQIFAFPNLIQVYPYFFRFSMLKSETCSSISLPIWTFESRSPTLCENHSINLQLFHLSRNIWMVTLSNFKDVKHPQLRHSSSLQWDCSAAGRRSSCMSQHFEGSKFPRKIELRAWQKDGTAGSAQKSSDTIES